MTAESRKNKRATGQEWLKRGLQIAAALLVLALVYEGVRSIAPSPPKGGYGFSGTTVKGEKWSLADRLGKKPVLVNFFATWCGPCKMEFPELLELQRKYRDQGFEVVLLTRESLEEIKPFEELMSAPVAIIPDAGPVFDSYGVEAIPHTYFFNGEGKLVKDIPGYNPSALKPIEDELRARG